MLTALDEGMSKQGAVNRFRICTRIFLDREIPFAIFNSEVIYIYASAIAIQLTFFWNRERKEMAFAHV